MTGTLQPVARRRRLWPWITLAIVVVLALVALSAFRQISRGQPETYASDEEHFKYGSITSDQANGLPYSIWAVLPDVCHKRLPGGYASLGVISEPGRPTPVGFSIRHKGIMGDFVGPNCALCHSTPVRNSPTAKPVIYLAAPAQQLDLMGYYRFLFGCITSPEFTADRVVAAIQKTRPLSFMDRQVDRFAVGQMKTLGAIQGAKFNIITHDRPDWGPGRVDTFNPYKVLLWNLPMTNDHSIGTADFMSIWDQKSRMGMYLHWDGNNNDLQERNLSAALGAQATPTSLNTADGMDSVNRVKTWITYLKPPAFPFDIDKDKAARGAVVYGQACASCHEPGGRVIPLQYLKTDPQRSMAFDATMAKRMNTIGHSLPPGPFPHFSHFRSTNGYASHPLDGIWLRAPYLHNGSVPTMVDLLNAPEQRPVTFYRGYDVYDPNKLGFVSNIGAADGRTYFLFDTRLPGNGAGGHLYGLDLTPPQKSDLIEYLKTK